MPSMVDEDYDKSETPAKEVCMCVSHLLWTCAIRLIGRGGGAHVCVLHVYVCVCVVCVGACACARVCVVYVCMCVLVWVCEIV